MLGIGRNVAMETTGAFAEVDGQTASVVMVGGEVSVFVVEADTDGHHFTGIHALRNPGSQPTPG